MKIEKTNILQIITNLELGGAQKQALFLIQKLDSSKYNKHLISAPQGLLLEDVRAVQDVRLCLLSTLKRHISPLNDLRSFLFIIKYIKQHNIHIVHTHSSKAGIIGRWAGCFAGAKAVIHTIHGWSFNDHLPAPLKMLYVFLERLTAKITTAFIAVSESDIRKGLDHKIGRQKQYKLIHYGININIDKSRQEKARLKQELGIDPGKVCVGMIACLKPQKNPLDFIRLAGNVCKKYPNVVFLSAGDGILRSAVQKLITEKKLADKVKLYGWRKDIEKILAVCDLIVLTSLWEGMPIALLEAMAFSKPVVAYACDGIKEMIQEGVNGYLVKPKDLNCLSQRVEFLLSNPEKAGQMGAKARAFSARQIFCPKSMLKKTQQLYEGCLYRRREN